MSGVTHPFTPTCSAKEQILVPSVSLEAASILSTFDLPQLLTAFNSIDKLHKMRIDYSFTALLTQCVTTSL
jgi:hypothetical protein